MIYSFYLSVAARKIVCADPSLRYASMLLGRQAASQPTNKEAVVKWQSGVLRLQNKL